MATINEIKTEVRHRKWTEQIQECQKSGQTVKEWCGNEGISLSTYCNRLRTVREEMLSRQPKLHEIVPVSVSAELTEIGAEPVLPKKASFPPLLSPYILQPASGRSSALPCLAVILVLA